MLEATSFNELTPLLPMLMVAEAPPAVVNVKDYAGSVALALVARSEYQDAVDAS